MILGVADDRSDAVGIVWTPPVGSAMVSSRASTRFGQGRHADVAQLVEHHLAKVRVAGSNPVVRSEEARGERSPHVYSVEWPRGEAAACKAVYTGSNPVSTSAQVSGPSGIR